MKTTCILLAAGLAACFLAGQAKTIRGNKNVVTRNIPVAEYQSILIKPSTSSNSSSWLPWHSGNSESSVLHYAPGSSASLKITMDENLFDALKVTSADGQLVIQTEPGVQIEPTRLLLEGKSKVLKNVRLTTSIDFVLDAPLQGDELEIVSTGSGDYVLKPEIRVNRMKVSLSGSGDVNIGDLVCTSLEARTTGSGDISLKGGRADDAVYRSSGSGDIGAYSFEVKRLDCRTTGSGDMRVRASETLTCRTSGSGDIHYKGAATVDQRSTGSGDIERAD